jgi:carbon monoxide dehydrogenase subunit G
MLEIPTGVDASTIIGVLDWMMMHGEGVLLNWGEDEDLWECLWYFGGRQITGASRSLIEAVSECLSSAREAQRE